MKPGERRSRRDAELLAQDGAGLLVDAERLRHLAACGERLHEHAVGGLAEWVVIDEASRGPLGAGQLGAAEPQAGCGVGLQRLLPRVIEPASPPVEPRKVVLARQKRAGGDVLGTTASRASRGRPAVAALRCSPMRWRPSSARSSASILAATIGSSSGASTPSTSRRPGTRSSSSRAASTACRTADATEPGTPSGADVSTAMIRTGANATAEPNLD